MPDLTASIEAICARVAGDSWPDSDPLHKASIREFVLGILNAAVAEGWRPPRRDVPINGRPMPEPYVELDWSGVYDEEDL